MDGMTISSAIERVSNGQIRIPAFQRGFVWDTERVAYFMDSIFKGYPFGALLLWRTREQLRTERKLGPFTLPAIDPAYPIDYVLDGQQQVRPQSLLSSRIGLMRNLPRDGYPSTLIFALRPTRRSHSSLHWPTMRLTPSVTSP